jgi:cysteinyl-tRNA synthetase
MIDGARVEVAHFKRDAKDFVLWKPSTPELPGWPSPWGRGRPGWHIECSAMIRKHLGPTIDIHGGGNDLMFPHHENELAQGTSLGDGATYVRYWMHNGMLTLGNEKMSKSLGNIVTIRDLLARERGETLRYALLSGHYRSPLAWTPDLLAQSHASLDRLYRALLDAPAGEIATPGELANAAILNFPDGVAAALCDDLNTPVALAALHEIANEIYRSNDASARRALRDRLLAAGWLLGLLDRDPAEHFRAGATLDAAAIDALVAERTAARKRKDFARADAIRRQLDDNGIELEDGADGTRWKVRPPRT